MPFLLWASELLSLHPNLPSCFLGLFEIPFLMLVASRLLPVFWFLGAASMKCKVSASYFTGNFFYL